MALAVQASLLDLADDVRLGALAGQVRRTVLAHGAWIDHRPGWIEGSDAVLDSLLHDIDWRSREVTPAGRALAHAALTSTL